MRRKGKAAQTKEWMRGVVVRRRRRAAKAARDSDSDSGSDRRRRRDSSRSDSLDTHMEELRRED